MKYAKHLFLVLILSLGMVAAMPVVTQAASAKDTVCNGINKLYSSSDCGNGSADSSSQSQLNTVIKTGVNIFSTVVGIIAVFMIIVGGFKYILSGGDASAAASAKNTILYAIVGLVVVALAQVMVRFIIAKF